MRNNRQGWSRRRILGGLTGVTSLAIAGSGYAAPSGKPVRVGSTLSLTGPLGQTAAILKIAGEIAVEMINKRDGFLGRPVEWVLLDDQSRPEVTRSLYEKLITVDKVDLIQGPYATAPILAGMGVAQRHRKVYIQGSMGIPKHLTYDMAFPSTPFGPEPDKSYPKVVLDAMAATATPPKSITVLTSKFPSAQFMAEGMREEAKARGLGVSLYLEYEFGTRDFGAIAARVKDANADFLWVGSLGLDSNLLLEAMKKLDYAPKRHFHLYPAPGPLALSPDGDHALSSTFLEPAPPFTDRKDVPELAAMYKERATRANVPYAELDAQGAGMYAQWQILEQAVNGARSLDDKALAEWLKKNGAETIYGKIDFNGPFNHGPAGQMVRQVQNKKWVVVWPTSFAPPGVKLIAP